VLTIVGKRGLLSTSPRQRVNGGIHGLNTADERCRFARAALSLEERVLWALMLDAFSMGVQSVRRSHRALFERIERSKLPGPVAREEQTHVRNRPLAGCARHAGASLANAK